MNKQIEKLAQALAFADYATERAKDFGGSVIDPGDIVKKGIGDLDFDPFYYLSTKQTSPEGWATK